MSKAGPREQALREMRERKAKLLAMAKLLTKDATTPKAAKRKLKKAARKAKKK